MFSLSMFEKPFTLDNIFAQETTVAYKRGMLR